MSTCIARREHNQCAGFVLSNIERKRAPAVLEVLNEYPSVGWLDALIDFSLHDRTGLDVFGTFGQKFHCLKRLIGIAVAALKRLRNEDFSSRL
jgi:hypothetical protein